MLETEEIGAGNRSLAARCETPPVEAPAFADAPTALNAGTSSNLRSKARLLSARFLNSPIAEGDGRLAGGVVGLHSPVTTATGDPTHLENWAAKGAMP